MISPPPSSFTGGGSRRLRYSRSPSDNIRPSKRSKTSNSNDSYDRDHVNGSDQSHLYKIICVKNINPILSDSEIRDLCNKKFSKYGSVSVRIYHRNQECVAFVYFTTYEEAREARHTKSGLVWGNMQVILEPVYYRTPMPTEQPMMDEGPHERSLSNRRRQRRRRRTPSPPVSAHYHPSLRHQHTNPPYVSTRVLRSSRRNYAPYIPLPPDLIDYGKRKSSRKRQHSSPSPARRGHHHYQREKSKQKRSRTPNSHRSLSRSASPHRSNVDNESNDENEPTRTLCIDNLDKNITESKLRDVFGQYGTIKDIDLKKSSKRIYAFIQYENVDMAFEARRDLNGHPIGKTDCKIGYGKSVPTKHLWIGNISVDIKRRDLEHAFARYGQIKTLDYTTGDPTAVITYCDVEDAVKARSKLNGTIKIIDGRVIRSETDTSPSSRRGFRIDFLDRPTSRRFVIVRPQKKASNRHESRSASRSQSSASSSHHDREHSPADEANNKNDDNHDNNEEQPVEENVKTERHSPTPPPPPPPPPPEQPAAVPSVIKQRRSTDHSESQVLPNPSPIAGRTFYGALGSYLSTNDTANVNNLNDLMILCEQLNSSATKSNTALSTVYPVQFILKSHAYDARLHFLAGSPTLASILLGQPGDLIAAKTELRITQRLRLGPQKLDELERTVRNSVQYALTITGNNPNANMNGHSSNSLASNNSRKQISVSNQTKFSILIASSKMCNQNNALNSNEQTLPSAKIKHEMASPSHLDGNNENHVEVKKEKLDENEHNNDDSEDEDSPLSQLISYLLEKEAAGVISAPFHPTYQIDHSSRQEIAVIHIFPPCQLSKKILKVICPSINFSNELNTSPIQPSAKAHDEHLMVIIVHNE